MISVGCAMAAIGEVHFELFGFVCQVSAVMVSERLVVSGEAKGVGGWELMVCTILVSVRVL